VIDDYSRYLVALEQTGAIDRFPDFRFVAPVHCGAQ
jgi:hypothetical protein